MSPPPRLRGSDVSLYVLLVCGLLALLGYTVWGSYAVCRWLFGG